MKTESSQQTDLRARYTPDARQKREQETSSIQNRGKFKLILGVVFIVGGIYIMQIEEAFLLLGIIPAYFGLSLCISGIVNITKGMDLDEFPKKIEVGLRLLPLVLAGFLFLFILNNF